MATYTYRHTLANLIKDNANGGASTTTPTTGTTNAEAGPAASLVASHRIVSALIITALVSALLSSLLYGGAGVSVCRCSGAAVSEMRGGEVSCSRLEKLCAAEDAEGSRSGVTHGI